MRLLAWLACALLSVPTASLADEFTRFTVDEFEGWVEDTGTSQGRIALYPLIAEPGTQFWEAPLSAQQGFSPGNISGILPVRGLEVLHDGRLKFGYRIITDARYIPSNFLERVATQTNIPTARLSNYVLHAVPIQRYRSVELEVGGRIVARDELGGVVITGGSKEGAFYLQPSKGLLSSLREGDYRLRMTSELPQAQFSSLQFEHSASAVSNSWIKAFREVTKKKRRSGFNAGFIDFSSAVQKVRVKEHIESGHTTAISSETDVLLRDPTPDQEERFKKLFGFAQIADTEMLAMHRASHAAALAAGSFNLADAHKAYIDALEANAPGNSDQILEKLALLSESEAMKFMTSGMKVSIGGASTSYKYDASLIANSSTETQQRYSEYVVRNTTVTADTASYRAPTSNHLKWYLDSAYKRVEQRLFGSVDGSNPLTAQRWVAGVAKAIQEGRVGDIEFALVKLPDRDGMSGITDYNHVVDNSGNRLLHVAVRERDVESAELLASNGADPNLKNAMGESSYELAVRRNYSELVSLLSRYKNMAGTHRITLSHAGMSLVSANFSQPQFPGQVELERRDDKTAVLTLRGYPHRSVAEIEVEYEFFSNFHPSNYSFGLRYAPVQNGWMIRAKNRLHVPYSLRDGASSSEEVRITWEGPSLGFMQHYDAPPRYVSPY